MNNLTFLQELIARWKAKSPKGFSIVASIAGILLVIAGLPTLLSTLNIILSANIDNILITAADISKGILAVLAVLIPNLTVSTPTLTDKVLTKIQDGTPPKLALTKAEEEIKK